MKKISWITVFLLAFLTACSSARNTSSNDSALMASSEKASAMSNSMISGGGGGGRLMVESSADEISLNQPQQTEIAPSVERKIIRNADMQLEADAPEEAQRKIAQIVESKGGFVVETQSSASDVKATTRDTVTMTTRVPAAKFDETLNEVRAAASRVIVENIKGEDVTEEFIDVEARLKTQKALEAQFLEIMKQAKSVEDALNVQKELADVRGEIEKVEGRKRFLESQASLSTIKIKLQTPTVFATNSKGFAYQLKESLGDGFTAAWSVVLFFVTALIALLPFLLFIGVPVYFVIRYFLRKNRQSRSADEIVREELKTD